VSIVINSDRYASSCDVRIENDPSERNYVREENRDSELASYRLPFAFRLALTQIIYNFVIITTLSRYVTCCARDTRVVRRYSRASPCFMKRAVEARGKWQIIRRAKDGEQIVSRDFVMTTNDVRLSPADNNSMITDDTRLHTRFDFNLHVIRHYPRYCAISRRDISPSRVYLLSLERDLRQRSAVRRPSFAISSERARARTSFHNIAVRANVVTEFARENALAARRTGFRYLLSSRYIYLATRRDARTIFELSDSGGSSAHHLESAVRVAPRAIASRDRPRVRGRMFDQRSSWSKSVERTLHIE